MFKFLKLVRKRQTIERKSEENACKILETIIRWVWFAHDKRISRNHILCPIWQNLFISSTVCPIVALTRCCSWGELHGARWLNIHAMIISRFLKKKMTKVAMSENSNVNNRQVNWNRNMTPCQNWSIDSS